MKRFLLLACILLCASVAHAGCDELRQATTNIDKAIAYEAQVIAASLGQTDSSVKRRSSQAQENIRQLMELRAKLYKQECFENPKPKPKPQAQKPLRKPQPSGHKKFKPAGKMH